MPESPLERYKREYGADADAEVAEYREFAAFRRSAASMTMPEIRELLRPQHDLDAWRMLGRKR